MIDDLGTAAVCGIFLYGVAWLGLWTCLFVSEIVTVCVETVRTLFDAFTDKIRKSK